MAKTFSGKIIIKNKIKNLNIKKSPHINFVVVQLFYHFPVGKKIFVAVLVNNRNNFFLNDDYKCCEKILKMVMEKDEIKNEFVLV